MREAATEALILKPLPNTISSASSVFCLPLHTCHEYTPAQSARHRPTGDTRLNPISFPCLFSLLLSFIITSLPSPSDRCFFSLKLLYQKKLGIRRRSIIKSLDHLGGSGLWTFQLLASTKGAFIDFGIAVGTGSSAIPPPDYTMVIVTFATCMHPRRVRQGSAIIGLGA